MNEVLIDLKNAVNAIEKFYYQVPAVALKDDELDFSTEETKYYERRFVSQLKTEYDKLIAEGATGSYKEVKTDLEVIKRYIFSDKEDRLITATYSRLNQRNSKKTFRAITTIPDFFIHKQQDNFEQVFQKLAVEVKTTPNISEGDFYLDLFKLNVYVEKYNFQNGVFLLTNNCLERVKELARSYLRERLYLAPKNSDRIYIFVKSDFTSDIEVVPLINV